ncbi:hypothetical protein FKW77_005912 [Venturia effusa]|uniref:Uncharacterized protein n=1 Tax=Venturia effusa TaxID=50376 RepID=A0A517LDU5_9PEZI|nr:hypothetical protein FKW77_005912 [Venturia effusa]
MLPSLVPILSILAAQASSAFAIATPVSNHSSSTLLNQPYVWYSRALVHGGIIIATADIKGQEWILTTIGKSTQDRHLEDNSTLILKEVYPVKDGEAVVGRFRLVERDFDFGAVFAPF